jgi:hypothetical protein
MLLLMPFDRQRQLDISLSLLQSLSKTDGIEMLLRLVFRFRSYVWKVIVQRGSLWLGAELRLSHNLLSRSMQKPKMCVLFTFIHDYRYFYIHV